VDVRMSLIIGDEMVYEYHDKHCASECIDDKCESRVADHFSLLRGFAIGGVDDEWGEVDEEQGERVEDGKEEKIEEVQVRKWGMAQGRGNGFNTDLILIM